MALTTIIAISLLLAGFLLGHGWHKITSSDGRHLDRARPRLLSGEKCRDVEEVARELLRMKLRAGRCRDGYAYNFGFDGVIKVAGAREYNFAMHAGVKEFWEFIPVLEAVPYAHLSAAKLDEDAVNCERDFAVIDDGYSKTYVNTLPGIIVPDGYRAAGASAEEVRQVIDYAKRKAHRSEGERRPVEKVPVHATNNTTASFRKAKAR